MASLPPKSIEWVGGLDGYAAVLDQTLLPNQVEILQVRDARTMWEAIRSLRVRGAPAIGIAAAMGLVLGVRDESTAEPGALLRRPAIGIACIRPSQPR